MLIHPSPSGCKVIGLGHTDPKQDSGFSIISNIRFIQRLMSGGGKTKLFDHGPPWDDNEIARVADNWQQHTGVKSRILFDGSAEQMAIIAARHCLDNADVKANQLDFIIGGSNTNQGYPSLADHILDALLDKPSNIGCFDVQEACPTGVMALFAGWNLIKSGAAKKVLVVCAEKNTTLAPYDNWKHSNLFGDGASAFLLATDTTDSFIAFDVVSLPQGNNLHKIANTPDGFDQDGNSVHKFVGRTVVQRLTDFIKETGIDPANIKHLVPHQPSGKTLDLLLKNFQKKHSGFAGTFHRNVETCGNLSSASTGLIISEAWQNGVIKPGELVVVVAFGSGLSVAMHALRL